MAFIEVRHVTFGYDSAGASDAPVKALDDVTLSFEPGEFTAVVGHNGSGKSTLAKLLNGLIVPDSGDVTVDGINTKNSKRLFDIRKSVGVVFQNPDNQMVASIIEDDIAFGPENIGLAPGEIRRRVDWALECVGMSAHAKGMAHRLSGGQKQRIAIAGVLALKPRVMVLDESTAMLDPAGRDEVIAVVQKLNREENMAVIMITHFMEEALLADRIVVMNEGRVFFDGGREIMVQNDALKRIGLEAPFAVRMGHKLKALGVDTGEAADLDALAEKLCRY